MRPPERSLDAPGVRLRFSRYEFKYLLTETEAEQLLGLIGPYIELDPFASSSGGGYEISSLYLDNDRFQLAGETLEGLRDRFKLRVRAYSDLPDDPVFFEVKQRRNGRISKARSRVSRAAYHRFFETGEVEPVARGEQTLLDGFVAKTVLVGAVPKVLVRYQREAFQGVFDSEVRITLDRNLRAARSPGAGPFFDRGGWHTVEGNRVVLEFKFNDRYPAWMAQAVRAGNLKRISFSKYALGAAASYTPPSAEQTVT